MHTCAFVLVCSWIRGTATVQSALPIPPCVVYSVCAAWSGWPPKSMAGPMPLLCQA